MRRWLPFMILLAAGSVASAAVSEGFSVLRVLAEGIMFAALFGPMYLAPRRYAEWTARCRLPRFGRRV